MKRFYFFLVALLLVFWGVDAAPKKSSHIVGDPMALFEMLDLERPGLEQVKKAYTEGNLKAANKELQKYFRKREGINLIDVNLEKISIKKNEQKWADDALEHKFYAHKGYESYFYGDDINWRLWPVKDNELRWQLHRHYWFVPLCKAYYLSRDTRYVDAWVEHYTDWVKKNPLDGVERLKAQGASEEELKAEKENVRFAWRPMETSRRMQDQLTEFTLTLHSSRFTPDFLNLFLRMYRQHADYIMHHFSKQGNHLLFEAQRMVYAGTFFPEFKEAASWRKAGIDILNREIGVQVYPDGMQFELDFGYHTASIDIFLKALKMARANGMGNEFPKSYVETVEKMAIVVYNLIFPDYSNPMFGDTKTHEKSSLKRQFRQWGKIFSQNEQLPWFASESKQGVMPSYTSNAFKNSGFYILRTGWDMSSTVTVVKAGPPAFWHNQPDNGTFDYWHKGRNFFPDSGSYVYAGDKEVMALRNWFRQTRVHNTLTLDNKNLEKTDSKLLKWETSDKETILVTENPSYEGLRHRRTMFFPKDGVLVIVDQVAGEATGKVGIHFNLCPSEISFAKDGTLSTLFKDGNNIRIKTTCNRAARITMEEGWVSYSYRQREQRPSYAVEAQKEDSSEVMFITVITPTDAIHKGSIAMVAKDAKMDNDLTLDVRVGGKTYHFESQIKE